MLGYKFMKFCSYNNEYSVIKEAVSKEEAEAIKAKLEAEGAVVEVK